MDVDEAEVVGLFEGYGGLTSAVQAVLGGRLVAYSEIEPAACLVLAHHHPDVPNLGDITTIDWDAAEKLFTPGRRRVMTAGYPCQPFSMAGRRQGEDDPRHLWPHVAEAIGALRPDVFVGENVRGHLNLGFDQVLRDLELLGYSVRWVLAKAADAGAPHNRARLFMIGVDERAGQLRRRAGGRRGIHRDHAHQGGGHVRDSGGRGDGYQGEPDPVVDAGPVRRSPERHEAGDRAECTEDPMGSRGGRSERLPLGDPASPDLEGGAGDDLSGAPRRAPGEQVSPRAAPLDRPAADPSGDREASDPRPQREGPGSPGTFPAAGSPDGGVPVGGLVGAERRPVRAGGVHGSPADEREDGGGARLPDGRSGLDGSAWPRDDPDAAGLGCGPERRDDRVRTAGLVAGAAADPDGVGPVRGGGARRGRAGSAHHDHATADAGCDGREGREERDLGSEVGQSAPLGGDAAGCVLEPTCPACGHPEYHHDAGGYCASCGSAACRDPELGRAAAPDATDGIEPVEPSGHDRSAAVDSAEPGAGAGDRKGRAPSGVQELGRGARLEWGAYTPAIRRWERILGRPAPAPTMTGKRGGQQLSPLFVEFMMGLPEGWVTGVEGVNRNAALKMLGNGVVPQQAELALRWLLVASGLVAEEVAA